MDDGMCCVGEELDNVTILLCMYSVNQHNEGQCSPVIGSARSHGECAWDVMMLYVVDMVTNC